MIGSSTIMRFLSEEGMELMRKEVQKSDIVFHLGAVGVFNEKLSCWDHKNNIEITEALLGFARGTDTKVVIFSTGSIRKTTDFPYNENQDIVLGPSKNLDGVMASKLVDEFLGLAYCNQHDLPVIVVRLFNTVDLVRLDTMEWLFPDLLNRQPWVKDHGLWRRKANTLLLQRKRYYWSINWFDW